MHVLFFYFVKALYKQQCLQIILNKFFKMALIIYTLAQNRNSVLQIKKRLKIILHLVVLLNLSLRLSKSLLRDEN